MRQRMRVPSCLGWALPCAAAVSACGADEPPGTSATPAGREWPQEEIAWSECGVRIDFGSFATGPDRAAMAAVDRHLRSDSAVVRVTRSRSGPEGEHSLCVRTASEEGATRLATRLIRRIPTPTFAPVAIVGPTGRRELPTR